MRYIFHEDSNVSYEFIENMNIFTKTFGGRFMCVIHGGEWQKPDYVFHCPICLFDVCLQCVASPCSTFSAKECCHTRLPIDLL